MNKLLLIFLMMLLAASVLAAPELAIDQPEFDFGQVIPGETVAYRSWLRSIGEDTVRLTTIKTGCGCLVASPLPDLLAPGDSTEIVLKWQTRLLTERKNTTAFLLAEPPQAPLRIDLAASPPLDTDSIVSFQVTPQSVSAAETTKSTQGHWPIELVNKSHETLVLSLIGRPGDEWTLEFPDSILAGESVQLTVRLANSVQDKEIEDSFTIKAKSATGMEFRRTISLKIGDFSFRPIFSTNK